MGQAARRRRALVVQPRPQQALHHAQPEAPEGHRDRAAPGRGCDALVENFRPRQLGKLGLGPEVLRRARPSLVVAHISGFEDGPYRDRAAFGVIGEAIGGLRHLTNHPPGTTDLLPPVRVGISIGDSLAGLYAAFGIMAALWQRDRAGGDGRGRTLDVALTEAVLSMMEGMLPEYGALGLVRQPTRARIPTAAPSTPTRPPTASGSDRRQLRPAVRQAGRPDGAAGARPRPALCRQPGPAAERRRARPHHRRLDQTARRRRGGPALERGRHSAPRSTPRPNARPTRSSGTAAWCARSRTRSSAGRSFTPASCPRARRSRRRALARPAGRRAHGRGPARAARPAAGGVAALRQEGVI